MSGRIEVVKKVCGNNDSNDSLLRTIKISIIIKTIETITSESAYFDFSQKMYSNGYFRSKTTFSGFKTEIFTAGISSF